MKSYPYWLVNLITAVSLVGCAAPTFYQAASETNHGRGYSEAQVDGALYRVNYIDSYSAGLERTYAYAMYRAAELARDKKATHFEVLEGLVDRALLARFIARPLQTTGHYDRQNAQVVNLLTYRVEDEQDDQDDLAAQGLPIRRVVYAVPTYIYVPVAPPPPPQSVSMLIRLLNAPSLDAGKGFVVQDLLTTLGPKVQRAPVKSI